MNVRSVRNLGLAIAFAGFAISPLVAEPTASSPPAVRKSDTAALATVNGEPVTGADLLKLFTDRHSGHAKFLGGDREARQFLDIVIEDRLLVQEAYALGLDQDPGVLELIRQYLEKEGTKVLVRREIDEKVRPTPEEVRAIWESIGFYVQAQQIAVETRVQAEDIRDAILKGSDVETLARACSRADSRLRGGLIVAGWGQYSPEWESVVFALQPGDVSPVIETRDGFEVVVVLDRDTVDKPEFKDVSSAIESVLLQRNLDARRSAFSNELWSKYHVVPSSLPTRPRQLAALLASAPDTVVATWDGAGRLTLREVFEAADLAGLDSLSPQAAKREIEARIRATVNAPLVALEAKARKIDELPEVAVPADAYSDYMVEAALFRDHIFRDLKVTDEEAQKYYETHVGEFVEAEQRHVAHILLTSQEEASTVREKLASGADFDELCRSTSKDYVTARSGGDLGWITAERVPPQFKEILATSAGGVSKPVHSAQGWHVVKVLEIKAARQRPPSEVQSQIREKALDAKKAEARKFWVQKLRSHAQITVHDQAIKLFVAENQMGDINDAPSVQHAIDAGPMKQ